MQGSMYSDKEVALLRTRTDIRQSFPFGLLLRRRARSYHAVGCI
jgi:hypothetical protein